MASSRASSGRENPDGIQSAQGWPGVSRGGGKPPFWSWWVSGGAGTLHLTGDATARRCPGANIPPDSKRCNQAAAWLCLLGGNGGVYERRIAGGDATGNAQRVPLAKIGVVLPRTSCMQRKDGLAGIIPPAMTGHRPSLGSREETPLIRGMTRCELFLYSGPGCSLRGLAAEVWLHGFMTKSAAIGKLRCGVRGFWHFSAVVWPRKFCWVRGVNPGVVFAPGE